MGRHSNIILVGADGTVIDAIKRINADLSSKRLVLPGVAYREPPEQDRLCLLDTDAGTIAARVRTQTKKTLADALLHTLQGVSPIVCREIQYRVGGGEIPPATADEKALTLQLCTLLRGTRPVMVLDPQKKPLDFTFMQVTQYGDAAHTKEYDSFSMLLDAFYQERDQIERTRQRQGDLHKLLHRHTERTAKKIALQTEELKRCQNRDELKLAGELISAHLYLLQKGQASADLPNYYEEGKLKTVALDPQKTPAENAQRYYKEYKKAATAEQMLTAQIKQGREELAYLDSVFESLSRADTQDALNEIRLELAAGGYTKQKKQAKKALTKSEPKRCTSSDGFEMLVGRNNIQNDQITLKTARGRDLWFHAKDMPGAHVVVRTDGKAVPEQTLLEAARLAAGNSKAAASAQVPVDYTEVRNVKKPSGAKPGRVIYEGQKTLFVTPGDK